METCPDCGVVLPGLGAERHAYMGGSASCWALYGQVLEREYSSPAYMKVHRTTVDAYAAQHPGLPDPRAIQSVNVHLVALFLTLDRKAHPDFVRRVLSRLARDKGTLKWLSPPAHLGEITVADVIGATDADAHHHLVMQWGGAVWRAWSPHHAGIIALAERVSRDLS